MQHANRSVRGVDLRRHHNVWSIMRFGWRACEVFNACGVPIAMYAGEHWCALRIESNAHKLASANESVSSGATGYFDSLGRDARLSSWGGGNRMSLPLSQ